MVSIKNFNKLLGKEGEDIATDFLIKKGYQILERNYTYNKKEIDIICKIENELVFVEVKTRSNLVFGYPEQAVNKSKQIAIRDVANDYLLHTEHQGSARFDIIAIVKGAIVEIIHIEDAFYFYFAL